MWASPDEIGSNLPVALARKETLRRSLVRKPTSCRLCVAFIYLVGAVLSLAALCWHTIRYGSKPPKIITGSTWLATPAEWSNRTRHLLQRAAELPKPVPLILLGRPRKPIRIIASLLHRHIPGVEFGLIRPLSFLAYLQALPRIIRTCWDAAEDARNHGYKLSLREAAAIQYRLQLGCVQKVWWRRSAYAPAIVIYGHTGNADTSLLEREQQTRGTRTVHLFHGFSTGAAFAGISDLAIAKCRHDAEWHSKLGGYGRSIVLAASRPKLGQPKRGWALLTNYAHPMAALIEKGVDHERQALEIVASTARDLNVDPKEILYRPHPSLVSLNASYRSAVAESALASGLGPWPKDLDLKHLREFALIITTPSTVLQDALLAGTVPVLLDLAETDEDSVYAAYPLKARSAAELAAVLQEVQVNRTKAFDCGWEAVGPGVNPSLAQIEKAAASCSLPDEHTRRD